MKTTNKFSILTFVFLFVTLIAQAQNNKQMNNDPSLSARNYKHPNKAAFAKVNNLAEEMPVAYLATENNEALLQGRDYKHGGATAVAVEQATAQVNIAPASRTNYKNPYGR